MKITKLEIHILRAPDEGLRPYWVSNFIVPKANEILVRMFTDEGIEGVGRLVGCSGCDCVRAVGQCLWGDGPRPAQNVGAPNA